MTDDSVEQVLRLYPQIFFAFHTRHVQDAALDQRLTAHQASLLDHLDADQPLSLSELTAHLGVTRATASLAVDRLVRMGYVQRDTDTTDARKVQLRLTPAGVKMRESRSVLDKERVDAALGTLSVEQRELVVRGLQTLLDAAHATGGLRGGRPEKRGRWSGGGSNGEGEEG